LQRRSNGLCGSRPDSDSRLSTLFHVGQLGGREPCERHEWVVVHLPLDQRQRCSGNSLEVECSLRGERAGCRLSGHRRTTRPGGPCRRLFSARDGWMERERGRVAGDLRGVRFGHGTGDRLHELDEYDLYFLQRHGLASACHPSGPGQSPGSFEGQLLLARRDRQWGWPGERGRQSVRFLRHHHGRQYLAACRPTQGGFRA